MDSTLDNSSSATNKKNCCVSLRSWIRTPSFFIYLNFFLSQWGDWMWQFAVGLYLLHLSHDELLLAAIFGFCGGGCVLLCGGIIGDWVDRNGRLKVVRVSLILQNMSVMWSAICVCVVLALESNVPEMHYGQVGRRLMEVAIVILAITAQLSNVAYTIAIEKDWIVVIAMEKSANLANLNAGTRSISLICKILSPTAVGFIMSYSGLFMSAIVIAGWNLVSVFIEYAILSHIYRLVPRMAFKKNDNTEGKAELALTHHEKEMKFISPETEPMNQSHNHDSLGEKPQNNDVHKTEISFLGVVEDKNLSDDEKKDGNTEKNQTAEPAEKTPCIRKVFEPFLQLARGWRTYARQMVVFAGVSLAFLYMTVLGFDSITVGYIKANDVPEYIVGISMALGGLTGIIGTILFTRFRKRFGLETTGLIAFSSEISCLVLAVISIWAPGSKFNPYFASQPQNPSCQSLNDTSASNMTSNNLTEIVVFDFNQTTPAYLTNQNMSTSDSYVNSCEAPHSHMSIILLLVGIIASRVGLWMADLVVTQLMQETVIETERGVVHGVQNSLNMLMDMLKFALVIVAPQIEIFGFHIIISFSFICMAGLFFVGHVMRVKRRRRYAEQETGDGNVVVEKNVAS